MNNVYVVFSRTNTVMGKFIRFFTKNEFNHVSLCFDSDLMRLYSFGRFHVNSPLVGGFVIETPERILYKDRDIKIKVCRLSLDAASFDGICNRVSEIVNNRSRIIYNSLSALSSVFHKKCPVNNAFTCIEFVTYVLDKYEAVTIRDLENALEDCVIYNGSYKSYINSIRNNINNTYDDYLKRLKTFEIVSGTVNHFRKLLQYKNDTDKRAGGE